MGGGLQVVSGALQRRIEAITEVLRLLSDHRDEIEYRSDDPRAHRKCREIHARRIGPDVGNCRRISSTIPHRDPPSKNWHLVTLEWRSHLGPKAVDFAQIDRPLQNVPQMQPRILHADQREGRPATSTAKSTSLPGRSLPRATEPNTARRQMPRRRSSGSCAPRRPRPGYHAHGRKNRPSR